MDPFLRLAGMLVLVTTLLLLAGAFLAAVYAAGRANRRLLRQALLVAAGATLAHGILVIAGPLVASGRVLPEGTEVAFCGFDCHLHVSARSSATDDVVVLRFRSDARAVPEHPGWLRVVGYDAEGSVHEPLESIPDILLAAGDTIEHRLRFPPGSRVRRVAVTWREWDHYLVPGPGNPLVQSRISLDLGDPNAVVRREES